MERFKIEQPISPTEKGPEEDIFERVTKHSREFDKQIRESRGYTEKEIREAWRVEEWKVADTTIKAIGVIHAPETFLEFRNEIEKAIQESDIVVNEFTPEALGLYDKRQAPRLMAVKSKFNENYNLEQLRQAYLKFERPWNIGVFHHEIELLAAKYNKDMACVDLINNKNPESLLQDSYLYAFGAEEVEERKAVLKRLGLYGTSAALGLAGLSSLLSELKEPMTRRKFLKIGLLGAAAVIAGVTPKITETPPRTALDKEILEVQKDEEAQKAQGKSERDLISSLRDPQIADSLKKLSESGYKKILFIYGRRHLKPVKEYLDNPEKCRRELSTHKKVIERYNPDTFRIYRLSPGENNSERFVASKEMIWKRVQ